MRLQHRVTLLFAVASAAAFLIAGWRIDAALHADLEDAVTGELRNAAQLLEHAIDGEPFSDSLADRLAAGTGLRVTLIGPDGTVLGDSDVPAVRLPEVENHADRPEVRAALAGGEGVDSRSSGTVSRRLLYLAVPHDRGVLRVSKPVEGQRSIVTRVRGLLAAGALFAALIGYAVGLLVTRLVTGRLRSIREAAEAIAAGDPSRRIRPEEEGELGDLGRALDRLADRFEEVAAESRRERADLDALFEGLDDGVAVLDADQVIIRANRAFRELAGCGDPIGERLPSQVRSVELRRAAEAAIGGQSVNLETSLRDRTLLASGLPHRGGALLVLKDLTALRRLEGVRRDFVANVSHELKTPLTTVVGFAEPIADGDVDPEESRKFGRRILHNAQRMRRLVEDLLDLSRIESGSWRPERMEVELGAAAREVWASLEPRPDLRGVQLVIQPPGRLHAAVDPGALSQILRNLLENAARYAPEASDVTVGFEVDEHGLRVEVSDSGPGIPPVHQGRVFERFYRLDPARSREEGGTGLGLSIVKHLVAAHGGEVGIESDVGMGTTVWFTIPDRDGSVTLS